MLISHLHSEHLIVVFVAFQTCVFTKGKLQLVENTETHIMVMLCWYWHISKKLISVKQYICQALVGAPSAPGHRISTYLIKEILHQVCNANIVEMPMSQQKFLEVLQFGDGIITVPHRLSTLFPLNAWNTKAQNKLHISALHYT